jgi:hypothetical protein
MSRLHINIGTTANDRTGDPLRTAFEKVNANFIELYATASADVQIPAQATHGGKFLTTNGTTLSWASVAADGVSSISDFGEGFSLNNLDKIVTNKLYSTNLTQPNQHYRLELDTNGIVVLPDGSIINGSTIRGIAGTGELNYTGITIGPNSNDAEKTWMWVDHANAYISTNNFANTWTFGNNGTTTFPNNTIKLALNDSIILETSRDVVGGEETATNSNPTPSNVFFGYLGFTPSINNVQVGWTVSGDGLVGTKTVTNVAQGGFENGYWTITVDGGDGSTFAYNGTYTFTQSSSVVINQWSFSNSGVLTLPLNGDVVDSTGTSVLGTPTVLDGGDASTTF